MNESTAAQRGPLRILFVAEAVTLAHMARIIVLANAAVDAGDEVHVAAAPRFRAIVGEQAYHEIAITSVSSQQFLTALAKGKPLYSVATLRAYVTEDRALLQRLRPDLVVGDFRLSLSVSAALEGVPYINISNAYWSPYAQLPVPVPELPLTHLLGVPFAQRLFDWVRPLAFKLHARPLNRVRREHGLPPLPGDLRTSYTAADYVCYADFPGLIPMADDMPANHRFLGPLLWEPDIPLPDWWQHLPATRPIVYLTLGSSGNTETLPAITEGLMQLDVTVMVATAGRAVLDSVEGRLFVADYLPGRRAAERAALVICNGGSPTTQQGLAAGVPVLGIPTNLDQHLNMCALEGAGVARTIRSEHVSADRVTAEAAALLADSSVRSRAEHFARLAREQPATQQFLELVAEVARR